MLKHLFLFYYETDVVVSDLLTMVSKRPSGMNQIRLNNLGFKLSLMKLG